MSIPAELAEDFAFVQATWANSGGTQGATPEMEQRADALGYIYNYAILRATGPEVQLLPKSAFTSKAKKSKSKQPKPEPPSTLLPVPVRSLRISGGSSASADPMATSSSSPPAASAGPPRTRAATQPGAGRWRDVSDDALVALRSVPTALCLRLGSLRHVSLLAGGGRDAGAGEAADGPGEPQDAPGPEQPEEEGAPPSKRR
eukprot:tig00021071_g17949.t1